MRAGGKTLTLLGAPRIYLILQSLAEGTKGQRELRRDAGSPAQSTLRGHLGVLEDAGVLTKHRRDTFPGALEYNLTERGTELLVVATGLIDWLAAAPAGPLELGGDPARAAIKGLVEGWSADVLTALAAGPLSLTELDKRISAVSYPTIERCLETMRLAEQLEVGTRTSRGTPYALTEWIRRGLAPLAIAARWEHRGRLDGASSISRNDIGGAMMLLGPLLELPPHVAGICQLAAKVPEGTKHRRALGLIEVRNGEVALGAVYPQVEPDAWASGTLDTWFSTVIDSNTKGLRLSGDRSLAQAILDRLHQALFKAGTEDRGQMRDVSLEEAQ